VAKDMQAPSNLSPLSSPLHAFIYKARPPLLYTMLCSIRVKEEVCLQVEESSHLLSVLQLIYTDNA
jgi:hypothetical protein